MELKKRQIDVKTRSVTAEYALKDWKTEDELDFLDHLGTHTPDKRSHSREMLLNGYMKASLDRNWGKINKTTIINYLKDELGV
jgi:hypothetical protein